MPICTTLRASMMVVASIAAAASPTMAANPPGDRNVTATSTAPIGGAAAAAGSQAVERLKAAIAARKDGPGPLPQPVLPPPATETQRRRAFEAMRQRQIAPAIAGRARSALAAAQIATAREREEMAVRLGEALGLSPPDLTALAKGALPDTPQGFVPLLFVSSSMPVAILRSYAAQLERSGGAMAFRGMPGGMRRVAPMAKLSADILRRDPGCEGPACAMRNVDLVVDPIAFRLHRITRVPALVMVPGDPTRAYCERDDGSSATAGPDRQVYGDAALSGLLDEYARLGGNKEVRDAQARLGGR